MPKYEAAAGEQQLPTSVLQLHGIQSNLTTDVVIFMPDSESKIKAPKRNPCLFHAMTRPKLHLNPLSMQSKQASGPVWHSGHPWSSIPGFSRTTMPFILGTNIAPVFSPANNCEEPISPKWMFENVGGSWKTLRELTQMQREHANYGPRKESNMQPVIYQSKLICIAHFIPKVQPKMLDKN